jgi:hypothetical protein
VLSTFQDFRILITMRVQKLPRASGQGYKPVARISVARVRAFRMSGFQDFNHDARSQITQGFR